LVFHPFGRRRGDWFQHRHRSERRHSRKRRDHPSGPLSRLSAPPHVV